MASSETLCSKVFISHAGEDSWVAAQMAKCIDAVGVESFFDRRDILAGDAFRSRIKDELSTCQELVALFTPWSMKKSWIRHEIGMADILGLRIVCVFYQVDLAEFDTAHGGGRGPIDGYDIIQINEFGDYLEQLRGRAAQPSKADGSPSQDKFEISWKAYVSDALKDVLGHLETQRSQLDGIGSVVNKWHLEFRHLLPQTEVADGNSSGLRQQGP